MKIKVTKLAQDDLDLITMFSTREWGTKQTNKYLSGLVTKIENLLNFPYSGIQRLDIGEDIRSLLYENHTIVYEIVDDVIIILRVFHSRKDIDNEPIKSYYI
jgi:toxin ParE1/3/4